ncbi:MAG: hypothetical protein ABI862_07925 [Ilumatobacteraceae bacterium]
MAKRIYHGPNIAMQTSTARALVTIVPVVAVVAGGGLAWYYFANRWKNTARGMVSTAQQAQTLAIQHAINRIAAAPGSPCSRVPEDGHWGPETDRGLACWAWLENAANPHPVATQWDPENALADVPRAATEILALIPQSVPTVIRHLAAHPWVPGTNGQPGHLSA